MAFFPRWQLILFALVLSCGQLFAANATKEQRAYAAAVSAFQDGMWNRAETEFAQFAQKYPKSTNAPEAVLMQAQAQFKQGKLTSAIALLAARKTQAGILADQYVYWIGEAQFQNGEYAAAAETFLSMTRDFPDSSLLLRAVVEAAVVRARLGGWQPQVVALLQETNGVFQRAAQMDPDNELVSRGRLLLAQAKFAQKDFGGAASVLESLNSQTLKPELDWQRAYLLYQIKFAAGDLNAALSATTNLLQIAPLEKGDGLHAESVAMHANALEKLNRASEAIAAYQENLTNAPEERQREAILKIAGLSIAQGQFANAELALGNFLAQFPGSPAADVALLTLGELHLKDYAAQPATNHLQPAFAAFDQFLGTFTNSPLAARAHLDRGWCFWLAGKIPESFDDFKIAAQKLPPSEDLAVARFKMGDALFKQGDFAGALANYHSVLNDFEIFPAVVQTLGDRALYQSLRADLELGDVNGASNVLAQILKNYSTGEPAQSSALLFGESLLDLRSPSGARAQFENIEAQFPDSPLRPQVELAIARTYESEQKWAVAIGKYESWLKDFPANPLQPQVDYALALANFQAGNETNAFMLFTNFVAQFPTNDLAPLAQWWVADHYFNAPEPDHFVNAERNYKFIFQNTNWQNSPLVYTNLAYQARMMAGRAAVGRLGYSDAIGYFTSLTGDTNCPPDLNAQALFAWGGALMRMDSPDTNNPLANFSMATNVFGQIVQMYPTNGLGALAWGEIGDCDLQLANYDNATNAYAQVFNSPYADVSARSRAQIGFGIALEKKAALATGDAQKALLELAQENYLDVFYATNLRDGESADPFWVKKAGLQALPLIDQLGEPDPDKTEKFINKMEELLPQLRDSLEKKRAAE